ncbi:MAG: DAK2 domain-containing protein [Eubacteriales bacterium]|nr:DAK2 domain-containing protein [Eubacteriales bacterium]
MTDISVIDASLLREMVNAGAAVLEKNREAVNALNVFPVPDGDTGTNMSMTMMTAVKEVNGRDYNVISGVAEALAKGALRGARGNSGVILSQLYRGFSRALEGLDTMTPAQFAAALKAGADTAYKAVMKPKEGTILTVARVIADDAIHQAAKNPDSFQELFRQILASGESIVKRTQEMLPVLTQAGVVDAGGWGLHLIYTGYAAVIKGERIEDAISDVIPVGEAETFTDDHDLLGEITFAYCTEFFIQEMKSEVSDEDVDAFRRKLTRLGDCVLVVGDSSLIKVHLHTNDPGKALQLALALGELNGLKIDNMLQQRRDNQAKKEQEQLALGKDYGIVSVSQGEGFSDIFRDLGVDIIVEGGQTMNPSIEDLQKAVDSIKASTIFLLPNNGNIILAAEQVAEMAESRVIVLPTKNVAMGIAAVIAFLPDDSPEENEARMNEAAEKVRTGMITFSVRDTELDEMHIKEGSIIGLNNGRVTVNCESATEAAVALMKEIVTEDDGLITVYYGAETNPQEAEALGHEIAELYPNCDVEVHKGGQPLYYYLLSVE